MTRLTAYGPQARRRINSAIKQIEAAGPRESSAPPDLQPPASVVRVKNITAAQRVRGDVVKLGDALYQPVDDSPNDPTSIEVFRELVGVEADVPAAGDPFGILPADIDTDADGQAVVDGLVLTRVNVTNEAHTHADVSDGNYYLASGDTGPARIIDKEAGTGTKWAYVLLGQQTGTAAPVTAAQYQCEKTSQLPTTPKPAVVSWFVADAPAWIDDDIELITPANELIELKSEGLYWVSYQLTIENAPWVYAGHPADRLMIGRYALTLNPPAPRIHAELPVTFAFDVTTGYPVGGTTTYKAPHDVTLTASGYHHVTADAIAGGANRLSLQLDWGSQDPPAGYFGDVHIFRVKTTTGASPHLP